MKIFIVVALAVLAGVAIGRWEAGRDIVKVYEDGSFIGCYTDAPCND